MVGISNLRRLAADHAMLHSTELPPCYFFPPSSADSSVDDLTQLTVFITGPTGTPYSQGLWKLSLKIPESYPVAPPKATFRTRIWHPNVEENTGSVCVDTLKKDWQPHLTLRDVLITIYCLLIQPNPDSALNSTAGHLLQEDYDSFSRQARLMTSIHGRIPSDLQDVALSAKRRGETAGAAVGGDTEQKSTIKCKSSISLTTFLVRKLPEGVTGTSTQSAPGTLDQALDCEIPASEDEHGTSASKENDPLLSPSPVPEPSPRRPSMTKRPLSDLYIIEPEHDMTDVPRLSHSEQNVVNNVLPLTSIAPLDSSGKGSAEKIQRVNKNGCGQETGGDGMGSDDLEGRPTKRICSDSGKENTLENWGAGKLIKTPLPSISAAIKVGVLPSGRASASSSLGKSRMKGKPRVGLRRL